MSLGDDFGGVLTAAQAGAEWALTSLYQDLHPSVLRYLRAHDPGEIQRHLSVLRQRQRPQPAIELGRGGDQPVPLRAQDQRVGFGGCHKDRGRRHA